MSHKLLVPELQSWIEARAAEREQIDRTRRDELDAFAALVASQLQAESRCDLTFICTHNSRRSHLAMIWAAVAAHRAAVRGITTLSGGTERTRFDARAVAAIRRAGCSVIERPPADNPRVEVRFSDHAEPLVCFSKRFDEPPNPTRGATAVMVCGHAEANCPAVPGARARIALTYDDPKSADGSPSEAAVYDERCRQIAREMLYAFDRVAENTG